ncbi:MAG: histidine kinase, partial [Agathobacter sp.]|nr:histidine kinase [Agathobacter sp.]
MPQKKPFRSVVTQIMVYPILIYIGIILAVVFFSINSFFSLQGQMVQNTLKTLQISMNQINNLMTQIDYEYASLWSNDETHLFLKAQNEDTPKEDYLRYQMRAYDWVQNIVNSYQEVQGAFSYYGNIDLLIFRGGNSTFPMQSYIREELQKEDRVYNQWEIVEADGQKYLFSMKKYGVYQGGAWIPTYRINDYLNAVELEHLGVVYLLDENGNSNLPEGAIQDALRDLSPTDEKIRIENQTYYNYSVGGEKGLRMGILVSPREVAQNLFVSNWGVLLLVLLAIGTAPICIFWLRSRIAIPVRDIDDTLRRIGEGDLEYHLPERKDKYENEFDHLMQRFNETMDRLQEAEYSLYESSMKEQRTKLMYISQQIRPHFILNALNIIYTYEEHEFPLVKKLVLYLTQYFRYVVNLNQDFVELGKEMRHIQNYLNIQKERYGDRFEAFVEFEPEVEDVLV